METYKAFEKIFDKDGNNIDKIEIDPRTLTRTWADDRFVWVQNDDKSFFKRILFDSQVEFITQNIQQSEHPEYTEHIPEDKVKYKAFEKIFDKDGNHIDS